jgi:hypothetical protein
LGAAGFGLDLVQYLLQARLRGADSNAKMVAGLKKRKLLTDAAERALLGMKYNLITHLVKRKF